MNNKITIKKKIHAQMIGLSFIICHLSFSVALVSCSDWTDHYEADSALLETQHQTLWQTIASSPKMTTFKALLEKAGYDKVLDNTQTYTVWAPIDGTYDATALQSFSNSRLLREFIENHVARNNYPASGAVDKQLYTINEKCMHFSGNQQYTIQDISISKPNVATGNGVIHELNGMIPFMANIYESLNADDHPIDSIANYYHSFDEVELNKWKSVQGPVVDGKITYLDSIFDERNDLYTYYRAYINREDSNYTMLVPTNDAWTKAKQRISQYYKYVPSFQFKDFALDDTKTINLRDVDSLREATVNNMLMGDLFYNNNLYYNKKLNTLQTGQVLTADSLYSTGYTKVYGEDATNMFENAVRYDKSNGAIWIVDSLRQHPWHAWNPQLVQQGENVNYAIAVKSVLNNEVDYTYVTPGTQNEAVSGHVSNNAYANIPPASQAVNPSVAFYLTGIRSTTYSIYIVTVPANIVSDNYVAKPYLFAASMGYADEAGKMKTDAKWTVATRFTSDPTRVDTIYLGDFTFPMAYYGTGNYYPYLQIDSKVGSTQVNNYDKNLRIDCIILRPKELADYLEEHPDYKYDRGNY